MEAVQKKGHLNRPSEHLDIVLEYLLPLKRGLDTHKGASYEEQGLLRVAAGMEWARRAEIVRLIVDW